MNTRFRSIRRGIRGNGFYCVDTRTGKRTSLNTTDQDAAKQLVEAKNIAERQPSLNLQIAKAYLAGTDNGLSTRTWQDAFAARAATKTGPTLRRWLTAAKDRALASLRGFETGQFSLASAACFWNVASSMPGTSADVSSSIRVMAKASPIFSKATLAPV